MNPEFGLSAEDGRRVGTGSIDPGRAGRNAP
jgi:hypothetical protein